ncbi:MAG TPA: FkbM family methyltransferase [Xanthobacteraceae bacterium]|jgi:FkbM family methyltransferase|nr:FkbM family methyltransferase [Xanthobacteraceae bacterium]
MNPDQTISLQTVNGWAILPSSLKRSDRSPRFHLHFLASLAGDVGAQHLIINEANAGYEPPTRDLLERVLRPGDLFVDVGAHWGFFSLQAATHPAGGIEVVAFEPDLINATMLTENVGRNKLSNLVTVIGAACGNKNELAPLVLNTTMGHSIRGIGLAPAARALSKWVPVVTLDGALANMGKEAPRRLILKIDAEGFEPNVIVGAQALLAAGRVALIIWERGPAFAEWLGRTAMMQMAALLSDCGFRHFLPPAGGHVGAPFAFDPQADYIGNVFSVGPQLLDDPVFASAAA